MSSTFERVFSESRKGEAGVSLARSREPPASVNPKIVEMLNDILEGINALGPRLDAIEQKLRHLEKEIKLLKAQKPKWQD